MFARLLLFVMLAAFATPAAAMPACHAPAPAAAMHHGMPADPSPDKARLAHVCIGCVPVGDWLGARTIARVMPAAPPADAPIARLDLGRAVAPALPPPRTT